MGAQLTIETRYQSRTNSITETTDRLKCIANAASSETSVGAETQDIEVSGGASAGGGGGGRGPSGHQHSIRPQLSGVKSKVKSD